MRSPFFVSRGLPLVGGTLLHGTTPLSERQLANISAVRGCVAVVAGDVTHESNTQQLFNHRYPPLILCRGRTRFLLSKYSRNSHEATDKSRTHVIYTIGVRNKTKKSRRCAGGGQIPRQFVRTNARRGQDRSAIASIVERGDASRSAQEVGETRRSGHSAAQLLPAS
jgi:hypothetical protein